MKKALVAFGILLVGALVTVIVVRSRPQVEPVVREDPPRYIRATIAAAEDRQVVVRSQGTIRPVTEATLVAEVPGTITWVSPVFVDGGFFDRGAPLLRIDDRDYDLAVTSARAEVARAEVQVARETAEAELALEEWQELGSGDAGPLVRREPQLAEARARLDAAGAALRKAELDLERTVVRAPFKGRVRARSVDLGEFLNRGTPLAEVYAVDRAELRLMVPNDELAFLELSLGEPGDGPFVEATAEFAGALHAWQGRVVRTGGAIDEQSRMVPLIAEFDDPYRSDAGQPPLAVGLFVDAAIGGRTLEGVIPVPRSALINPREVLIIDDQDQIRRRQVEVIRRELDTVLVSSGLQPGDRVALTPSDDLLDGQTVVAAIEDAVGEATGDTVTADLERASVEEDRQ